MAKLTSVIITIAALAAVAATATPVPEPRKDVKDGLVQWARRPHGIVLDGLLGVMGDLARAQGHEAGKKAKPVAAAAAGRGFQKMAVEASTSSTATGGTGDETAALMAALASFPECNAPLSKVPEIMQQMKANNGAIPTISTYCVLVEPLKGCINAAADKLWTGIAPSVNGNSTGAQAMTSADFRAALRFAFGIMDAACQPGNNGRPCLEAVEPVIRSLSCDGMKRGYAQQCQTWSNPSTSGTSTSCWTVQNITSCGPYCRLEGSSTNGYCKRDMQDSDLT